MKNVTVIFNKQMKMSDLIDADYRLLLLLHRLNISLGFGEKSIEVVCKENNFDPDCFIFLANYQTNKSIVSVDEAFSILSLEPFLYYLSSSHSYFLEKRLPNIKRKLEIVFSSTDKSLLGIVLRFFDDYTREVYEHMQYENNIVFPYIRSLLNNKPLDSYSIKDFEDRHNNIESKMDELKQILMKYVSGSADQLLMINILMELYMSEEELEAHTFIEDYLVIPRVKKIEEELKNL